MLAASVVLYLLVTLIIGYFASKKVKSAADFAVAGRKLPFFMSTAALFATWFGSETILGSTEEFLENGLIGIIEEPLGAALCLIIVGLFYARKMYRTNAYTFSDVFGTKFGRSAELVSAFVMIPSFFSWIAAQLIAMSMLFQLLFGMSFFEGILVGTIFVVAYTAMGGMWAVSWTDAIQTSVIIIGLIVILVYFLFESEVGEILANTPASKFELFDPQRMSWINWIGAWCTVGLGSVASQDVFQRVISAKNERVAILSSLTSAFLYLVIGFLPILIVWIGSQNYPELYAANKGNFISTLIFEKNPVWIKIIYFGALISALMSTASGAILAPATVLAENVLRPIFPKKNLLILLRVGVVIIALLSALITFSQTSIFELAGQASAFSLVSVFIPFSFTLFYRKTTKTGVISGMLFGLIVWTISEALIISIPSFLIGMVGSYLAVVVGNLVEHNFKKVHETA